MNAAERFRAVLNFEPTDRPVMFGELRHTGFIRHATGRDIRDAAGAEAQTELTVRAYAKAGITVLRSLMLPKWGLAGETMWDGYLNWKPGGDRQMSYGEALAHLRALAVPANLAQVTEAALLSNARREAVQALMGDDIHYMPNITHRNLEGLYHDVGLENFAYLMADEAALLDDVLEVSNLSQLAVIDATLHGFDGPAVHFCDDLGMKNTTLFAPEWLREHYFPRLKQLVARTEAHGVRFTFHSCGNVSAVLEDIMATGVTMLDGLEWTSGMRLTDTRAATGGRLVLSGNADTNKVSLGAPEDVRAEARRLLAEGGRGYVAPCYFTQNAPLENVLAWLEVMA